MPAALIDDMIPDGQALVVDRRQAAAFMLHVRPIILRHSNERASAVRGSAQAEVNCTICEELPSRFCKLYRVCLVKTCTSGSLP